MRKNHSFTLIELLVVIGVVLILAGVVWPVCAGVFGRPIQPAPDLSASRPPIVVGQVPVAEAAPVSLTGSGFTPRTTAPSERPEELTPSQQKADQEMNSDPPAVATDDGVVRSDQPDPKLQTEWEPQAGKPHAISGKLGATHKVTAVVMLSREGKPLPATITLLREGKPVEFTYLKPCKGDWVKVASTRYEGRGLVIVEPVEVDEVRVQAGLWTHPAPAGEPVVEGKVVVYW